MPPNEQNIVDFPEQDTAKDTRLQEYLVSMVNAAVKVLNARLLCILSLLGAIGFWGLCMADPTVLRIICGACYSVGVLLPVLAMYSKKG